MEKRILQEINKIKKRMQCSKGFLCSESGYAQLCKAKDIGLKRHLLCQEQGPLSCDFSLLFEQKYYCGCPLRVYLKKNCRKRCCSKQEQYSFALPKYFYKPFHFCRVFTI